MNTEVAQIAFNLPDKLVANAGTKYDKDVMWSVLYQIATSNLPLKDICETLGIAQATIYWWKALHPDIVKAWKTAMVCRTHILADTIEEEGKQLDVDCSDEEADPRQQTIKIKRFDIRSRHREWFMSRVNRKDFGDNIEIENNVNVSAAQSREAAWKDAREVVDAQYTEVSPKGILNRSVNPENNEHISP